MISALWKDHKFKASLGYIARPCLKNKNKTNNKKILPGYLKKKKLVFNTHTTASSPAATPAPVSQPKGRKGQGLAWFLGRNVAVHSFHPTGLTRSTAPWPK
jgi:hypothetical protein